MNKLTILLSSIVLVTVLAGCAYKSDVYKVGKDTYTITGTSDYGFAGARDQALRGASETCSREGKFMQIRSSQQHKSFLFWSIDLTFLCLSENDKEYKRTNMRKDNGVSDINLNIN